MDTINTSNQSAESDLPRPTEPFPCPECGQLLAPTCQICVACKAPVDFAKVGLLPKLEIAEPIPVARINPIEPARFSWGIFFSVFLVYIVLASLVQGLLGFKGSPYAMGGFVLATSVWVFADARAKGIPKPAGWAIACLLFWLIFFPWYISRRRTPHAPCPIIEGESGPVTRILILVLILLTLAGAVAMILSGDFALK